MARFGEYELVERIAVGGMAEVYKARVRRPGGVGKTLCIKRVHPKYCADTTFRQMFIEEARIGVTLSHGNIVPVFDFGSIDGLYYLAMEFVDGRDLAQIAGLARLVGLPFPSKVAVYVAMEVLEGLHYAHERSEEDGRPLHIVHRDISPSNLLISNAGEVKILDFGIARAEIREFETRTGVVKGTPGYMSPEQREGGRPDRRADVYAVGVILWELLQNERYPADHLGPAPPTGDPEIDRVLARATATDSSDRFATAREMRDALQETFVARGLHPGSADLAAYVKELAETPAAEENWRYRSSSSDDLAAASEPEPAAAPPSATAAPTRSLRPAVRVAPVPRTERIVQPSGGRRRVVAIGIALVAVGVAAAAAAVVVPGLDDAPRTAQPARPTTGTLVVSTSPPGAEVALDGDGVGRTPHTATDLPVGEHELRLRLDGYREVARTVTVRRGAERTLEVPLEAITGRLRIETDPAGADIEVDGHSVGTSPVLDLELPPGVHEIKATLEGRPPVEWEERVDADRSLSTVREIPAVRAPPLAPARLSVNTIGAWGEVFLDGRKIGNTPVQDYRVTPGFHRLVVKNPTRDEQVYRFHLAPGQSKTVVVEW